MEEKNILKEEELTEIVFDLGAQRKGELSEFLNRMAMFGGWIKYLLKQMFGGSSNVPVSIKGNRSEIESFSKVMAKEKDYISLASKHGLDNPHTYKSKAKLQRAVNHFERQTGIKWPLR